MEIRMDGSIEVSRGDSSALEYRYNIAVTLFIQKPRRKVGEWHSEQDLAEAELLEEMRQARQMALAAADLAGIKVVETFEGDAIVWRPRE